jgi:hypothetical protein
MSRIDGFDFLAKNHLCFWEPNRLDGVFRANYFHASAVLSTAFHIFAHPNGKEWEAFSFDGFLMRLTDSKR